MAETHNPLVPPAYDLVWSGVLLVLVLVVIAAVVVAVVALRRAARRRRPDVRLAELDALHARGVISDEEHGVARADVLRG